MKEQSIRAQIRSVLNEINSTNDTLEIQKLYCQIGNLEGFIDHLYKFLQSNESPEFKLEQIKTAILWWRDLGA